MNVHVQFAALLTMIVGGFYLGIAKDTLRRFSPRWEHRPFLLYGIEISFWLMNTTILYYALYRVNAGELRVVLFIACLLGFAMYQALAQSIYQRVLEVCVRIGTTIFMQIANLFSVLIIRPIRFLFVGIKRTVFVLLTGLVIVFLWICKVLFFPLIWAGKKVYRLLPSKILKFFPKRERICSIIKNISKKLKNIWSKPRRK